MYQSLKHQEIFPKLTSENCIVKGYEEISDIQIRSKTRGKDDHTEEKKDKQQSAKACATKYL
jgi:hypothetical protein